nr:AI-2E family transporter [Anaerolineae bacterium]
AMIAGLMQLIPSIGPFLGAIPAILIGWTISPAVAVAILGLYFLVQQFIFNIVTPRVEQNIVDVHPSIFILILVSLSQFGFWWILLAAPVTAIIRDTFRYVYGRFSEPSRPPGLLPGEPLPVIVSRQTAPVNQRRRLGRNINATRNL